MNKMALMTLAHVQPPGSSARFGGGDKIVDTIPLTVGQVGWVDLVLHTPSVPARLTDRHPFSNRLSEESIMRSAQRSMKIW